ncbi:MAG: hypothetical protein LBF27_10125 [Sphingobacterium sp.]|nr:hypothetical protein [Sphingobacterium sp.]
MKNETFIGSSVIFPYEGDFLCLTAGHNLYGRDFDDNVNLTEWSVIDHIGTSHSVSECIGDANFAREHDIIVLKLNCCSDLQQFHSPKFYTIPKNPSHSFVFRGRYEGNDCAVTQPDLRFINICQSNKHKFFCKIDKNLLMNSDYKSGNDWLSGWSGSGLFLDNPTELMCFGIMIEIPNKGDDGQLKFTSVSAIKNLNINLEIADAGQLDFDQKIRAKAINQIFDQADDEAIRSWELDDVNKPQLDYINEKLQKVYTGDRLVRMKRNTIKKLMVGRSLLYSELRKQDGIYESYLKANNAFGLKDLDILANNREEANEGLRSMTREYEDYLERCLNNFLDPSDIKILASYGISEWISNCSLSFY